MGIVRQGIEKEIGAFVPGKMVGNVRHPSRENQALRCDPAGVRLGLQIGDCRRMVDPQPEDAVRDCCKNAHPDIENVGGDLERVVEAAEYEAVRWQAEFGSRQGAIGNHRSVCDKEAVG